MSFFSGSTCIPAFIQGTVPVGTCEPNVPNREYMRYFPDPSGTCQPTGGELSGEVTTFGTTTFCCMPQDS